jgi:hypothetical protein
MKSRKSANRLDVIAQTHDVGSIVVDFKACDSIVHVDGSESVVRGTGVGAVNPGTGDSKVRERRSRIHGLRNARVYKPLYGGPESQFRSLSALVSNYQCIVTERRNIVKVNRRCARPKTTGIGVGGDIIGSDSNNYGVDAVLVKVGCKPNIINEVRERKRKVKL